MPTATATLKSTCPQQPKILRSEIDHYALINEKIKALSEEANSLKEKFRDVMGPGDVLEGFAFAVEMTSIPQIKGKVDYKGELIAAKGPKFVASLEMKAAADVTDGTPSIRTKPNVNASEAAIQASFGLRKELTKAMAEGKPLSSIVAGIKAAI